MTFTSFFKFHHKNCKSGEAREKTTMLDWQENNCHEAWSLQLIKEIKIVANKLLQNVRGMEF